jgi:hypothetical protein
MKHDDEPPLVVAASYDRNVFVNCPLDAEYKPMLDAMLFTIHDCGFVARLAVENASVKEQRLDRIMRLVLDCRWSIHDVSRIQLRGGLPRFNMPFECGLAFGAMRFAEPPNRDALVMTGKLYQDRKMLSDLSGTDPVGHNNKPRAVVAKVRHFLAAKRPDDRPHGPDEIWRRYSAFRLALPEALKVAKRKLSVREVTSIHCLDELIEHMCLWIEAKNELEEIRARTVSEAARSVALKPSLSRQHKQVASPPQGSVRSVAGR